MPKAEFDLIIITSPGNFTNETGLINLFLDSGVKAVYLRKEIYPDEFLSRSFDEIKQEYHHKIILPSFAVNDLILKNYNPIIHIKEKDRANFSPEKFPADTLLSTPIHDVSQLKKNSDSYQYLFYSPVFGSISKPDYKPKLSIEELTSALLKFKLRAQRPRLIALGGISNGNIKRVIEAGFDGAALLGAIWNEEDPLENFYRILSEIR